MVVEGCAGAFGRILKVTGATWDDMIDESEGFRQYEKEPRYHDIQVLDKSAY